MDRLVVRRQMEFFSGTIDQMGIDVTSSQVEKGKKLFIVFNSSSDDTEFIDMSRTGLSKEIRGTGFFKIKEKLKMVKTLANEWEVLTNRSPLSYQN